VFPRLKGNVGPVHKRGELEHGTLTMKTVEGVRRWKKEARYRKKVVSQTS